MLPTKRWLVLSSIDGQETIESLMTSVPCDTHLHFKPRLGMKNA